MHQNGLLRYLTSYRKLFSVVKYSGGKFYLQDFPLKKVTMTHGIHLEVDELATGESDDHLAAVDRAPHDRLLARRLPLVDSLVLTNVSNALGVDLQRKANYGPGFESQRRNRR